MSAPAALSALQVAALLRDMAGRVELGDSLEGSVEYLLPPAMLVPPEYDELPDKAKGWYEKRTDGRTGMELWKLRPDSGSEGWMMVRASYRIGNARAGQGGVRIVGTP